MVLKKKGCRDWLSKDFLYKYRRAFTAINMEFPHFLMFPILFYFSRERNVKKLNLP
jgi:hypothetical protein